MTNEDRPVVVVGMDGSPGSRAALGFALDDAARRGASLRVVVAAQPLEYWAMTYGVLTAPPLTDTLAGIREEAQRIVDEALAERPGTAADVPISLEARSGSPVEVLCDAAEGADLLVLGHRGRGALRSAVLGSVGLSCVLHAPCPVTVVRTAGRTAEATLAEAGASA